MTAKHRCIILGFSTCPHCRALMRLFKEVSDIVDVGYIDLGEMVEKHMSESDKLQYIKKLQSSPISLPQVLMKQDDKWKSLDVGDMTRKLILRYGKQLTTH